MRHMFVVMDLSYSMEEKDLRPNRLTCTKVVSLMYIDWIDNIYLSILQAPNAARRLTEMEHRERL